MDKSALILLCKQARISQRVLRELRFPEDSLRACEERELTAFYDRSGNEGVLVVHLREQLYCLPFTVRKGLVDTTTGRTKPVICDFCCTWQKGGHAASITFKKSDTTSITYLCCADLLCSLHVRDATPEAALSRSQLREDITPEKRIERLKRRLQVLVDQIC